MKEKSEPRRQMHTYVSLRIKPVLPGDSGLFKDSCYQAFADLFTTMGIGYDDGDLSPGHDVMPGAWVGTIKSQLAQSLYKLTS